MESWFIPCQVSELPCAQKALILAPHPDDEVFGCGGAAALLQQRGVAVDVLVLTDGAGLVPEEERHAIAQTRQSETNSALAALGLPQAEFWSLPDRSLAGDALLASRIASRIQGVDLVFVPGLTEVHPDHAATGRATVSALQILTAKNANLPSVMFYEVGAPLAPNLLLDITDVWSLKQQAMGCFQSQQQVQDYARHIEALNIFRTYSLGRHVQYAEAYHLVPATQIKAALLQQTLPTRLNGRDMHDIEQIVATAESMVETLRRQLTAADRTVAELTASIARQNNHGVNDVAQLRATISELEQSRQSLLNSKSWRLTRPLRWLSEKLSRYR